ncbi:trans-aconitate methyltransferase [Erythrobacter flavus]|nr:trans-aconitate methyltransferase [Qipengyuania flava]
MDGARLGLWLLSQTFPTIPANELRILDIIRGTTFSVDRSPLTGEEEIEFRARYARLIEERDRLREEYE